MAQADRGSLYDPSYWNPVTPPPDPEPTSWFAATQPGTPKPVPWYNNVLEEQLTRAEPQGTVYPWESPPPAPPADPTYGGVFDPTAYETDQNNIPGLDSGANAPTPGYTQPGMLGRALAAPLQAAQGALGQSSESRAAHGGGVMGSALGALDSPIWSSFAGSNTNPIVQELLRPVNYLTGGGASIARAGARGVGERVAENLVRNIAANTAMQAAQPLTSKLPRPLEIAANFAIGGAAGAGTRGGKLATTREVGMKLGAIRDAWEGEPVTLYRGDSTPITNFSLNRTDQWALLGQGIYLTDSPEVAARYRMKGASPADRGLFIDDAPTPESAIEKALQVMFEQQVSKYADDIGKQPPQVQVEWIAGLKKVFSNPGDYETIPIHASNPTADLLGYQVVKKGTAGALTEAAIPRKVLSTLIDAERPPAPDVAKTLMRGVDDYLGTLGDLSSPEWKADRLRDARQFFESGGTSTRPVNNLVDGLTELYHSFGDAHLPALQASIRRSLTDEGWNGYVYSGGKRLGGSGKHNAYVLFDETGFNRATQGKPLGNTRAEAQAMGFPGAQGFADQKPDRFVPRNVKARVDRLAAQAEKQRASGRPMTKAMKAEYDKLSAEVFKLGDATDPNADLHGIEGTKMGFAAKTPGGAASLGGDPALPRGLGGAKPRMHNDVLNFESDLDKALYIVGNQTSKSTAHAQYVAWIKAQTGLDDAAVAALATHTRAAVIEAARMGDHDVPRIGLIDQLSAAAERARRSNIINAQRNLATKSVDVTGVSATSTHPVAATSAAPPPVAGVGGYAAGAAGTPWPLNQAAKMDSPLFPAGTPQPKFDAEGKVVGTLAQEGFPAQSGVGTPPITPAMHAELQTPFGAAQSIDPARMNAAGNFPVNPHAAGHEGMQMSLEPARPARGPGEPPGPPLPPDGTPGTPELPGVPPPPAGILGMRMADGSPVMAGDLIRDVLNVPASLMSSIDISGFRQIATAAAGHPIRAKRAATAMLRSLATEAGFAENQARLASQPWAGLRDAAGVEMRNGERGLTKGEGTIISTMINKIPGYRRSQRAYVGLLNTMADELFQYMLHADGRPMYGIPPSELAQWGKHVNISVGRGQIPEFLRSQTIGQGLAWAPRLIASRIELPLEALGAYNRGSALVRDDARRQLAAFIGINAAILGGAAAAGADVEIDQRSADWGQVKIGQQRLDFLAGYRPFVNLLARELSGESKSTRTGDVYAQDRVTTAMRFGQSKLDPNLHMTLNLARGEDEYGRPYSAADAAKNILPLSPMDILKGIGAGDTVAEKIGYGLLSGLSEFGVGTNINPLAAEDRYAQEQGSRAFSQLEPSQQADYLARNPDVAASRSAEKLKSGGTTAEAEDLRMRYVARQEADDAALQSGAMNGKQWRESYNSRQAELAAAREQVFHGKELTERGGVLGDYFNHIRQNTLPDGNVDWDTIDAWRSSLPTADNDFIDRNTSLGTTPVSREFSQARKAIAASGYWALGDELFKQFTAQGGFPDMPQDKFWPELQRQYVEYARDAVGRSAPPGAAEALANAEINRIRGIYSRALGQVREGWLNEHMDIYPLLVQYGYRVPSAQEAAAYAGAAR